VPLLVAKTTLIRARVTGTPGIITNEGVVDREEEGVKIEVKVAEVEAIRAKTNHVRTLRFKTIILKISYQLINVPFAARRAIIRLIVLFIRGFKPNI
jgi:hypothetical protein